MLWENALLKDGWTHVVDIFVKNKAIKAKTEVEQLKNIPHEFFKQFKHYGFQLGTNAILYYYLFSA